LDEAVRSAKTHGADIIVAPFNDAIGRDAIVEWPGGVRMQPYWHTSAQSYAKLQTLPENRVYVSPDRVDAFVLDFVAFSNDKMSDERHAPGVEIRRPNDNFRRVRIASDFGDVVAMVTDGHLPFPYGHEITGYEVASLSDSLEKARTAGAKLLIEPYLVDGRRQIR
jgi:hypothetical protein